MTIKQFEHFHDCLQHSLPNISMELVQIKIFRDRHFKIKTTVNIYDGSDLIIDGYFIRMTISNEVEVMNWAGPERLVEEGKSVTWKTLGETEEEQEDRQPDSEVILINVGTGI